MNRRRFLKMLGVGTAVVVVAPFQLLPTGQPARIAANDVLYNPRTYEIMKIQYVGDQAHGEIQIADRGDLAFGEIADHINTTSDWRIWQGEE